MDDYSCANWKTVGHIKHIMRQLCRDKNLEGVVANGWKKGRGFCVCRLDGHRLHGRTGLPCAQAGNACQLGFTTGHTGQHDRPAADEPGKMVDNI